MTSLCYNFCSVQIMRQTTSARALYWNRNSASVRGVKMSRIIYLKALDVRTKFTCKVDEMRKIYDMWKECYTEREKSVMAMEREGQSNSVWILWWDEEKVCKELMRNIWRTSWASLQGADGGTDRGNLEKMCKDVKVGQIVEVRNELVVGQEGYMQWGSTGTNRGSLQRCC